MREPKPYELADKAISKLNFRAVSRAKQCKNRLTIAGFDELNVMQQLDALYNDLDGGNRRVFRDLFATRYIGILLWLKKPVPNDARIDALGDYIIANILLEPDPVTRYSYDAEVLRKKERAKEAVQAAPTKVQKQLEIDKAIRLWSQQTAQYVDTIADAAALRAFEDAGVKEVVWHTQQDEKVCNDCDERDGKTYPIDKIPPKPHWRCRCWISPK